MSHPTGTPAAGLAPHYGGKKMPNIALMLGGLLLHFAVKWREARMAAVTAGKPTPGLFAYVQSVPAQTLVAIVSAVIAYYGVEAVGWLNPGMAISCGYMGNSIADNLTKQFSALPKNG